MGRLFSINENHLSRRLDMHSSSPETEETADTPAPPAARKMDIRMILVRVKIGARRVKGWILRGGSSRRLICSVGKRDSCEMRKLCGGRDVKK
jgi:hypothetical protein